MAKEYAIPFYNSKAWEDCRRGYLQSVQGLCERCRAQGVYEPAVIVHHKKYISEANINDPSITLSWDNLEALCRKCHNIEHTRKGRRYFINDDGEVSPLG